MPELTDPMLGRCSATNPTETALTTVSSASARSSLIPSHLVNAPTPFGGCAIVHSMDGSVSRQKTPCEASASQATRFRLGEARSEPTAWAGRASTAQHERHSIIDCRPPFSRLPNTISSRSALTNHTLSGKPERTVPEGKAEVEQPSYSAVNAATTCGQTCAKRQRRMCTVG